MNILRLIRLVTSPDCLSIIRHTSRHSLDKSPLKCLHSLFLVAHHPCMFPFKILYIINSKRFCISDFCYFSFQLSHYQKNVPVLNVEHATTTELRHPCLTPAATLPSKVRVNFTLLLFLVLSLSSLSEVGHLLLDLI